MKSDPSFTQLVADTLQSYDFQITFQPLADAERRVDFRAIRNNQPWLIEVKFYRTERAQRALLDSAALRLVGYLNRDRSANGVLVVSCVLDQDMKAQLEKEHGIAIADRADVISWVSDKPDLMERLLTLLEPNGSPVGIRKGRSVNKVFGEQHRSEPSAFPENRGTSLCQRLTLLAPGKPTWSEYEALCEEILKYLFASDLQSWQSQSPTRNGLHRFDQICRIRPTTAFWNFLIHHVNSRYVTFEFKNYSTPISQGEVLTTEKYLLEKAFRRVAIMLTRKRPSKSAKRAIEGAMRESGKLILVVDDNQLCEMLHKREHGEDPSDFLFELADDFLMTLPR